MCRNHITGRAGGLALSELAGYKAVYRDPVAFSYRAPDGKLYMVHGAPMPFSGAAFTHALAWCSSNAFTYALASPPGYESA